MVITLHYNQPIQGAAWSKAWVVDRSLAGIVSSNPSGGMDVFLVSVVRCQVEEKSVRRADHSSRGVLSSACV